MYCSNCGAPNPEGSSVCGACGATMPAADPASRKGQATTEVPPQLHAMRVGDILDETIRLFRYNFRTFIGIVAVLQVPLVILQMVQFVIVGPAFMTFTELANGDESRLGPVIFWVVSSIVLGIVGFLAFLFIQAALASAISERYLGHQIGVGRAYHATLSRFWPMFGTILLSGLVLILLAITIVGFPFAVYFGIRWSFIVQTIVLEGTGVRQSLSRSSSLVKGNWWRVLGVLILVTIIQSLVASIPSGIIAFFTVAVGALISPDAIFAVTAINTVIAAIFAILAAPLEPTVCTLLYYDLRIRKEGFDLQLMADRLSQNSPATAESLT